MAHQRGKPHKRRLKQLREASDVDPARLPRPVAMAGTKNVEGAWKGDAAMPEDVDMAT
ncbi:hypothetical protein DCS_03666 [Drechmeria coniospora]|uniref:Uncharacterized protein n=1 Tax=Drechmeria coniospora TaxID=98403 RepID=A0A151GHT7_DRECN|nr:hypothetical protein DCS_03666 [Drechmeria coniospora]KYK56664.1 hypothetical protein DCS_03666 [Drechmeria coniospora]